MKLNKKEKIIIGITLIIIALTLFTVYILKSGSEKFAILNIESVESVNDPALKIAIEATERCNEIETPYKNGTELYRKDCYRGIAWYMGEYYGVTTCEKLKKEFKLLCYFGYGRNLGKKYAPNMAPLQEECSKTDFYEKCLREAAFVIGIESAKHIETEQCKKFEQESIKQRCYEGMGRQLAEDNRQLDLCKKTEDEESCLLGFAYITYNKGSEKESLQICDNLNDLNSKTCHYLIGISNTWAYNQTIDEAFKNCYSEECKHGAAAGIAIKFFSENQQKNEETASVTTPVTFTIYETINSLATKIGISIKQQIIPHFINYKLIYLTIILSTLGIIIVIKILKNKKVQKVIKKKYQGLRITTEITHQKLAPITKKVYQELTRIIRDILSIDKTVIKSFFKELKTELRSKEGKKKL